MKNILFSFWLLCLLLTSCITHEKCLQRYPPQIITKDSTVYKDSLIYVRLFVPVPGDSVTFYDTIPCPEVNYQKEFKSPSGKLLGTVILNNGNLTVKCRMDSLQRIIDSLFRVKQKEVYKESTKLVPGPEVVKYKMPGWCWWMLFALIACLCWIFRKPLFYIIQKIISPIKIV